MKRILPKSKLQRLRSVIFRYRSHIIWSLLWMTAILIGIGSWQRQPKAVTYANMCVTKSSVMKAQLITPDQLESKPIPLSNLPANAITNCQQKELFTVALTHDLQKGDLLQRSAFEKPEELLTLQDQLSDDKRLFALPLKDLHAIPFTLKPGITIDVLAKSKKSEDAVVLLSQVTVIDLRVTKKDDTESVSELILALDQKQALSLTKAIADQAVLTAVEK